MSLIFNGKRYSHAKLRAAANAGGYWLEQDEKTKVLNSGDIKHDEVAPEVPGVDKIIITKVEGKHRLVSGNMGEYGQKKVVFLTTYVLKKCAE